MKMIMQKLHKKNSIIYLPGDDLKIPLSRELGFEIKLTTYVAWHAFAAILLRSGEPLALAKQTLEFASIATTEKYFARFGLDKQSKIYLCTCKLLIVNALCNAPSYN